MTCQNASTDMAKRIAVRANRIAQIDLEWNPDVLLSMPDELIESLWTPPELSMMGDQWAGGQDDPNAEWQGMPEFEQ